MSASRVHHPYRKGAYTDEYPDRLLPPDSVAVSETDRVREGGERDKNSADRNESPAPTLMPHVILPSVLQSTC